MTKETAKKFWNAHYRDGLTWEEINERIGYKIHRYTVHLAWRKYGLKVPNKRKSYDSLIDKLGY